MPTSKTVTRVAPILRGLLAQPTGDDDHPYRAVILKSHTGADALSFENVRSVPLRLEPLQSNETDEELRTHLAVALTGYKAEQGANPEYISLPDAGVFQVIKLGPHQVTTHVWRGGSPSLPARRARSATAFAVDCSITAHTSPSPICPARSSTSLWRSFRHATPPAPSACRWMSLTRFGRPRVRTDHRALGRRGYRGAQCRDRPGLPADRDGPGGVSAAGAREHRRDLLVLAESGRQFARQKLGGDVVLISTKNVFAPGAGFGAYSATKAAAHQLARIASLEFAPLRCPGQHGGARCRVFRRHSQVGSLGRGRSRAG